MAAEGEVSPKRLTDSYYDERVATRPASLLRRTSRGGASNYYSSFDNSVSACSNGETLPTLASATLDSPIPAEYLDDSSDHEREDDKEDSPVSNPLHAKHYADDASQWTVDVVENVEMARDTWRVRFHCPEIAARTAGSR